MYEKRVRDLHYPPSRTLMSDEVCVITTPPVYASPRISSHLIISIYICRPGLAVPMKGHYLILLSNLWSHIPAHCPFMIETLILYSYTSAKSLQQSYHSLREKLQSSLVRFGLTRPKLPISGLWRLAVGHAVTTVTWPLSTY